MENNAEEFKGFFAYRTTLRAVSDGVALMTQNATMLLKASWPLLLLTSLAGGWLSMGFTKLTVSLLTLVELTWNDILMGLGLPLLLTFCLLVVYYALIYTFLAGFVEKGFLPTPVKKRFWLCPKITKLGRMLLSLLWVVFVYVVYLALAIVLYQTSPWTCVATLPVALLLSFWLTNQVTGYVLIAETLAGSAKHSFGVTLKGFGSFLSVGILMALVFGVIGLVCQIPMACSETIYMKYQFSLAEGDSVSLPGYFMTVYFLACTFSMFLMLLLQALCVSCWSMVYGAVDTRLKLRRQEKLRAASVVEVPGNA